MAGAMVSASTGVMHSVIGKLTAMLDDEYQLIKGVKGGIRFLRDELSSMDAVLQRLADMGEDRIDVQTKEWRNKVRELSYDIEDCIDRFMVRRASCGDAKANFVRKSMRKMKMLWDYRQIAKEIQELKTHIVDESERHNRYNIDPQITIPAHVPLDPRAPTLYEEARNLVGIDGPRQEITGWIISEEKQLKVVSIFGTGGLGKTTLAMEIYNKIEESFDCRALVSVSQTPDIRKLLRDILFQVNSSAYDRSEKWEMGQLIRTVKEYLVDKRYFIIVDDIWSISAWEHVKSALPVNNNRSRIITTTRIKGVASSCCTGIGGIMYEAKPLSEDDSQRLFFKRAFCSREDCPHELRDVANEIIRKCGGLPLAIISMASLLANKSKTVEGWMKIRNFISSAVDKDSPVDKLKLKRILSLSYFDLPHYLKSCLLYLSVFPEDYSIDSRNLIWRWVAEGLIPGQNRESMEQLGESYLNELINRSMIQPTKIGVDGITVKTCRVHDVILDFIISQAVEENFVTVLNGTEHWGNYANKIRRLSLQSKSAEAAVTAKEMKIAAHLRSLNMFGCDLGELGKKAPCFLNSHVLRVVSIEKTWNLDERHIEHIGSFSQLKYLGITGTKIIKVPDQLRNLQHLEILDLRENKIKRLPEFIVQLHKLVRLFVSLHVQLPDGIGNLQALEELSEISLDTASVKCIQELARLTKLRELHIGGRFRDKEAQVKACISSIAELVSCSLQSLYVRGMNGSSVPDLGLVSCGSPPRLRRLVLRQISSIPSRISSFVNLSRLRISLFHATAGESVMILASLPLLCSLTLCLVLDYGVLYPRQVIGSQGFQRLVKFNFRSMCGPGLLFEHGAMPMLQRIKLDLTAMYQVKYGGLVWGLQHMSGLRHITVNINCITAMAEEVEALEDDIKGAAVLIPNHPILEFKRTLQDTMKGRRRE